MTPPLGRIMFRDLSPVTPGGFPARGVAGDPVPVAVTLVRDGHGLLAGRARWRPIGATTWDVAPLQDRMDGSGRWVGCFAPAAPGMYEFEVQAWWDRFATWRRDLRERAAAAQDLTVEFEVGARLIESMLDLVDPPARDRLGDAVSGLHRGEGGSLRATPLGRAQPLVEPAPGVEVAAGWRRGRIDRGRGLFGRLRGFPRGAEVEVERWRDVVGITVLDCRNDGTTVSVVNDPAVAPTRSDRTHYERMIRSLCSEYRSRFAR